VAYRSQVPLLPLSTPVYLPPAYFGPFCFLCDRLNESFCVCDLCLRKIVLMVTDRKSTARYGLHAKIVAYRSRVPPLPLSTLVYSALAHSGSPCSLRSQLKSLLCDQNASHPLSRKARQQMYLDGSLIDDSEQYF
jgi:hypothetical protein